MKWIHVALALSLALLSQPASINSSTSPPSSDCENIEVVIINPPAGRCPNGARRYWYECRDNGLWYCWQECVDGRWGEKRCFVGDTSGGGYIMDDPTKVTSTTCDYDCPPDLAQKVIYGRRKVRTFNCVDGRVRNDVVEVGQCGDPRCKRRIKVECKPGRPCPPCPPGRTGGVCDYCTPGDTRDCNGVTQVCGPDGVFPPCSPPCVPGSKVFCPCSGEWLECDPVTGEFPYCRPGCIPGQTIYCPSGEQRICRADCTYDPCTPCPPEGCKPPPCTEECCLGDPVCVERPGEWVCSWAGREIVRVPQAVPSGSQSPTP